MKICLSGSVAPFGLKSFLLKVKMVWAIFLACWIFLIKLNPLSYFFFEGVSFFLPWSLSLFQITKFKVFVFETIIIFTFIVGYYTLEIPRYWKQAQCVSRSPHSLSHTQPMEFPNLLLAQQHVQLSRHSHSVLLSNVPAIREQLHDWI